MFEENASGSDIKTFLPLNKNKILCWVCYKLVINETLIKFHNKMYCSQYRIYKFIENEVISCHDSECQKQIEKNKSFIYQTHRYCSEECLTKNYNNSLDSYTYNENQDKEKHSSDICNLSSNGEDTPYDPMTDF